jgi:hypothetical protein
MHDGSLAGGRYLRNRILLQLAGIGTRRAEREPALIAEAHQCSLTRGKNAPFI